MLCSVNRRSILHINIYHSFVKSVVNLPPSVSGWDIIEGIVDSSIVLVSEGGEFDDVDPGPVVGQGRHCVAWFRVFIDKGDSGL